MIVLHERDRLGLRVIHTTEVTPGEVYALQTRYETSYLRPGGFAFGYEKLFVPLDPCRALLLERELLFGGGDPSVVHDLRNLFEEEINKANLSSFGRGTYNPFRNDQFFYRYQSVRSTMGAADPSYVGELLEQLEMPEVWYNLPILQQHSYST